ncbi:hypothetical protein KSC_081880 [Ktedonobacter sp. SOSP1-52]|uniref:hypothetical protein n=1 Tax=Ktedonobacter sp. SOSP1-52 TaxID=2778366 RepID=UPI0019157FE1|nr:hypothetical protein [Ktedonobacter sp. SOSP1-52]GHO69296.1 hypothetical protein KSC_081880 [Ktedonobacter sp. SOSP1-52]
MAYLRSIDHPYHSTLQEYCFYCGSPISYPAIHRVGNTGSITLHTNCAVDLSIKIMADVNHMQNDMQRRIRL